MVKELLTPQNHEYIERAREVAEKVMRPVAAKYDAEQTYPWEVQHAIKDANLSGVWIPEVCRLGNWLSKFADDAVLCPGHRERRPALDLRGSPGPRPEPGSY